jgi:hypothetical protein
MTKSAGSNYGCQYTMRTSQSHRRLFLSEFEALRVLERLLAQRHDMPVIERFIRCPVLGRDASVEIPRLFQ